MENETETVASQNDTEITENQEGEQTSEQTEEQVVSVDDVNTLKKQIATLEAQKNHWKDKATKPKVEIAKKEASEGYSLQDVRALSDVHDDDIGEIVDYARLKKISIPEAKKTGFVRTLLNNKAEERATAQATNTRSSARGSGKVTGDSLLSKALERGELPESDEDMRSLAEARLQSKLGKR